MNQEVAKLLSELSAKLGTTIEYLWPKLVAYAHAEAITKLAFCAVVFLAATALAVYSFRVGKMDEWESPLPGMAFAATSAIAFIAFMATAAYVPKIVVPEAAAIKMLLGQ